MPLGTFAPGAYTATYNTDAASGIPPGKGSGAQAVGLVQGVIPFTRTAEGKDVKAGLYGDTTIDGVYRGGDQFVTIIMKEWTDIQKGILWPFGETANDFGVVGPIGALMTSLAGVLTLTADPGTPAASTDRKLIVVHSAVIAMGHKFDINFGHDEVDIPLVFRCYPIVTGSPSVLRWSSLS